MREIIRRFFLPAFLLGLVAWLSTDIYIYNCWRKKKDNEDLFFICKTINLTKPLPEKIIKAYDKIYPGASGRETSTDIFLIVFGKSYEETPSLFVAYRFFPSGRPMVNSVANQIEKRCTVRKCLEYYLNREWFGNNCIGISNASEFYFKKKLEHLNEEEILSLIFLLRNPTAYDPLIHPGRLKEEIKRLGHI